MIPIIHIDHVFYNLFSIVHTIVYLAIIKADTWHVLGGSIINQLSRWTLLNNLSFQFPNDCNSFYRRTLSFCNNWYGFLSLEFGINV